MGAAYDKAVELGKQAKQRSLEAWFQANSTYDQPWRPNGSGHYHSVWCPRCGVTDINNKTKVAIKNDSWFECYRCTAHGSIIDAEIEYRGGSLTEAAERILGIGNNVGSPAVVTHERIVQLEQVRLQREAEQAKRYSAVAEVIHAVARGVKEIRAPQVMQFLTGLGRGERGLPLHVVEEAISRNMLRTMPANPVLALQLLESLVSRATLEAADLWKPDAKMPWICYRPLWFIAPGGTSAELRITRLPRNDEAKSCAIGPRPLPYYWEGANPNGCGIGEGFLDMLSAVALGFEGDFLALQGAAKWSPEWFVKLAKRRGTKIFTTMMDNDTRAYKDPTIKNPGQTAAMAIGTAIVDQGLKWNNVCPPDGDINDFWLSKQRST